MRASPSAILAWSLCALTTGLTVAAIVVSPAWANQALDLPNLLNGLLSASFAVVFGLVGAVIVARLPRNTIGWLMMIIAVTLSLQFALVSWVEAGGEAAATTPTLLNLLIGWYNGWAWWGLMGPLLLIPVLFPTGRPLTPRWRWAIGSLAVAFGLFLFIATFVERVPGVTEAIRLPNPIGFIDEATANAFFPVWSVLMIANVALCVSAIFVRYRRAAAVEREQIKWLLYACTFLLASFILTAVTSQHILANIIFDVAIISVPLAIGSAILRYRLWDIDILIRRTLVYSLLTALLALAYFGSVVVLQGAAQALTGERSSALVTVISTLLIAALFVPVRARLQRLIDRRFYRQKYDAAHTLAAFGTQARDEVGLDQLSGDLVGVVQETMQPAHVSLWVRDQSRR